MARDPDNEVQGLRSRTVDRVIFEGYLLSQHPYTYHISIPQQVDGFGKMELGLWLSTHSHP